MVSGFSILILGGFLIGSAASHAVTGNLQTAVMTGGIVGILSFLGLDQVKVLRRKLAAVADRLHVEGRLDRHVDRLTYDVEEPSDDVDGIVDKDADHADDADADHTGGEGATAEELQAVT